MNIIQVPVDEIIPYDRNPRVIGSDSVETVANSLRLFGFRQPIVLDADKVIIVGHTRFQAALSLGMATVPCVIADGLTTDQVRAYRIADNRTNEIASWNEGLLIEELKSIGAEIDMSTLGFGEKELATLLAPPGDDEVVDVSQADAMAAKWACERGKVWQVGAHRLMCGDSTSAEDVGRLFAGASPGLMVTDPPYGVEYDASWRNETGLGATKRTGKVANDDIVDWTGAYKLFPGPVAYVWHAGKYSGDVQRHLQSVGLTPRTLVVWRKTSLVISRGNYHWQHEPCVYSVRESQSSHWVGQHASNVWDIPNRCSKDEGETEHSTQKPIECMARAMRHHSLGAVYDPFCGSGTTIVAAEREGRSCFAMELTPGYCGIILERFLQLFGVEAVDVTNS